MTDKEQVTCLVGREETKRELDYKFVSGVHVISVPKLKAGEEIIWVVGDERPRIVRLCE